VKSLRLWNVRGFEDTGVIPLRPLTLLVGQNAAGKSTVARWLPLLRQSVVRSTPAPLLWYVEGGDVDFGGADRTVRRRQVEMGFEVALDPPPLRLPTKPPDHVEVVIDASTPTGRVSRVVLSNHGDRAEIRFEGDNIKSVSVRGTDFAVDRGAEAGASHIIPVLPRQPWGRTHWWLDTELGKALISWVSNLSHGRATPQRRAAIAANLPWAPQRSFRAEAARSDLPSFAEAITGSSPADLEPLRRAVAARSAVELLPLVDDLLRKEALRVGYIGPFRKNPNRYERMSAISTDFVDVAGANLPMVLRSMEQDELDALSEWSTDALGFGVRLSGGEHIEVSITQPGIPDVNIIDTGFGYSQVLPVIVALWRAQLRARTLVVEQPELHLHPALQSRLGAVFAATATAETKLVVETHSLALVNAVGAAIEEGSLSADDVTLALFERAADGVNAVRLGTFGKDGRVEDLPSGFLSG